MYMASWNPGPRETRSFFRRDSGHVSLFLSPAQGVAAKAMELETEVDKYISFWESIYGPRPKHWIIYDFDYSYQCRAQILDKTIKAISNSFVWRKAIWHRRITLLGTKVSGTEVKVSFWKYMGWYWSSIFTMYFQSVTFFLTFFKGQNWKFWYRWKEEIQPGSSRAFI